MIRTYEAVVQLNMDATDTHKIRVKANTLRNAEKAVRKQVDKLFPKHFFLIIQEIKEL